MIRGSRLLAASALAASGAIHLSGVSLFWREAPVEVEGGAPAAVARLGNSFQDVAAGIQAPETPEQVQYAEPPQARTARGAPEPTAAQTRPEPMPQVRPTRPEQTVTAREAQLPKSATTATEVVRPSPMTPDEPDRVAPEPEEPTVLAALPQNEDDVAPLISTRPNLRPRAIEEATPPEPRQQPKRAAPAPGSNQPQQVRGSTEGQRTASQTETSDRQSAVAAQAGNAAASNYPGEIMRAISRQRRPSVNARGTATVSFEVASTGALAGLGITRSSGSQALDAAAVELLRRAAPFPPPPAGARRSFTIRPLHN